MPQETTEIVRAGVGDTLLAKCAICGPKTEYNVIYEKDGIHNLRCRGCGGILISLLEGPWKKVQPLDFPGLLERQGRSKPTSYRTDASFRVGQFVEHSSFGIGYVMAVQSPPKKMEVLFEDQMRVLVCAPGSDPEGSQGSWTARPVRKRSGTPHAPRPRPAARAEPRVEAPREVPASDADDGPAPAEDEGPIPCPKCGRNVHPFNIVRDSSGKVVGCMYCR